MRGDMQCRRQVRGDRRAMTIWWHLPEDAILAAAYLFEQANGRALDEFEIGEIACHGLSGADPALISETLKSAVLDEAKSDPAYRHTAYWALGKRVDRELLSFFRDRLELELLRDLETAYQIMIALHNLDEPVFSKSRTGYGVREHALNRKDAEIYLASLNKNR